MKMICLQEKIKKIKLKMLYLILKKKSFNMNRKSNNIKINNILNRIIIKSIKSKKNSTKINN